MKNQYEDNNLKRNVTIMSQPLPPKFKGGGVLRHYLEGGYSGGDLDSSILDSWL